MTRRAATGLLALVLAFVACTTRGEERSGAVVAFGDSVAAGYGLGRSGGYPNNPDAHAHVLAERIGRKAYNFAISASCAATAGSATAARDTPESCKTSIQSDQIPRAADLLGERDVALVVVTVGANDIEYTECAAALFARVADTDGDPCAGRALRERLGALDRNLAAVYREIGERFPRATIVAPLYYSFAPPPVDDAADACSLYEPPALLLRPLSVLSDSRLRDAAKDLQNDTHRQVREAVDDLNRTIRRAVEAAGGLAAPVDFSGHDVCRDDASDVWVYGPVLEMSYSIAGAAGRSWDFTIPSRCPSPDLDPKPFAAARSRSIAGVELSYDVRFEINCMPHPTEAGQRGIADAIHAALPAELKR